MTAQQKNLEFTDDPFKDYRYEDPFNIKFDEEPDNKTSSLSTDSDVFSSSKPDIFESSKTEKFDPFGLDGRQSVPLPSNDPFVSSNGRASAPISTGIVTEDLALAWAARESLKLEEDRKKRQLQEQADLELAISLSKAENNKS